jgi:hypothetical protein
MIANCRNLWLCRRAGVTEIFNIFKTRTRVVACSQVDVCAELPLSTQITYTLSPFEATLGVIDAESVLLRRPFDFAVNVSPPSVLALNIISVFPGVLSLHATYTLSPDTAIAGSTEEPEFELRLSVSLNEITPSATRSAG